MSELPAFDYYDPTYVEDPYPILRALRDQCPVSRGEGYGGYWAITRYRDVEEVAHDTDTFSSRYNSLPMPEVEVPAIPPLQYDPPSHGRIKRLLSTAFVPKRVTIFEPEIRDYTVQLLQTLKEKRTFDASWEFARMVPTFTLCRLLGVRDDANADRFTQ